MKIESILNTAYFEVRNMACVNACERLNFSNVTTSYKKFVEKNCTSIHSSVDSSPTSQCKYTISRHEYCLENGGKNRIKNENSRSAGEFIRVCARFRPVPSANRNNGINYYYIPYISIFDISQRDESTRAQS